MNSELFRDPALAKANLHYLLKTDDLVDVSLLGARNHPRADEHTLNHFVPDHFLESVSQALQMSKSHFLGAYAETLWQCYLREHPSYELLESGLQIHQEGKTLGEFDFICQHKNTGEFIHQELAVKFYLGLPVREADTKVLWFGPNNIDRLDKKCAHLKAQQLIFSKHPVAKARLEQMGIETIKTECIIRGRLFLPANEALRQRMTIEDEFTRKAATCLWYTLPELKEHITAQKKLYGAVLHKPQWISAFTALGSSTLERAALLEQLTLLVEKEKRAVMIKLHTAKPDSATVAFVVPEGWVERSYNSVGALDA